MLWLTSKMFMQTTVKKNVFLILNSVPVTFVTDPPRACSERTVLCCKGKGKGKGYTAISASEGS